MDCSKLNYIEEVEHKCRIVSLKSECTCDDDHSVEGHLETDTPLENFLGGVEVPVADYDKMFNEDQKYSDAFPEGNVSRISLDGETVLIRCCAVVRNTPPNCAWKGAPWETVKKFNADHGLPLTKSVFHAKWISDKYINQTTEP